MKTRDIPVPQAWPNLVRRAVIHISSLAHWSIAYTRSMCADSPVHRVKLKGKLDRAWNEISLLKEELRIKDARMARLSPRNRPHYAPTDRLAILMLKYSRGWNIDQTAKAFLIEPETISNWHTRFDEDGDKALIRTPVPVNRFPDFVAYVTQCMKVFCPRLGKRSIPLFLSRLGLYLSATSVRRFLECSRRRPVPPEPKRRASARSIRADYPNHIWHLDLTTVPVGGFATTLFTWALPQRWPFCFWIFVVLDHFSRRCMGFAVFRKMPKALEVQKALNTVIKRNGKPRHIISDRGKQFDCREYRAWCRNKSILYRYGAIGKHGSIAVIERFIRTLKNESTRRIMIPLNIFQMREELALYVFWYNAHRPHQTLRGRTPEELYRRTQSPPKLRLLPNSTLREMRLRVSYLAGRQHLPIFGLDKAA